MNNKKPNWFCRILIILLCVFLTVLISISFLYSEEKFVISTGVIICIAFLIVLILSEVFDNFNIANIINIKKEARKNAEELEKSKAENYELKQQILTQINLLAKQTNNQIISVGANLEKIIGIEKIPDEEICEKKEESLTDMEEDRFKINFQHRRAFRKYFENFALNTILNENDLSKSNIFKDIQFKEAMIGIDPIMDKNIRFDAYYTENDCEYFIEVKSQLSSYSPSIYTIYYMLNKIYFYKMNTNKKVKLLLILPIIDSSVLTTRTNSEEDFEEIQAMFLPAIQNDILEIKTIKFTKEEYEKIVKESN